VRDVISAGGVHPNRLTAFGRGESQPIATNMTPEGRAQNRRVEINIIPMQ
jgi:outer membrane protein OmpA-like peptidoglycan-associated protein